MSALPEISVAPAAVRMSSWRLLMSNRLAAFGFFLLVLICFIILLAPPVQSRFPIPTRLLLQCD
ncbi:hypothetical protein Q644_19480 [Brucella intermedia 229E]|uniref:Oligopeptide transport permease C-like N-terminal domain-containing protein n=1 Tax=Brucella intermedia 229E TaxID=1337887 RepID=U4V7B8_9HYPH|nr:hypothetical protein Q644_19480 [Brucella intermedia 229E]